MEVFEASTQASMEASIYFHGHFYSLMEVLEASTKNILKYQTVPGRLGTEAAAVMESKLSVEPYPHHANQHIFTAHNSVPSLNLDTVQIKNPGDFCA